MAQLTPRQQSIIALLAQGYNQKEAARALGLKHGTVRAVMLAARKRTESSTTTEIVVKALQPDV
jgi:DNA-binding NarL/FixJ family response regulator